MRLNIITLSICFISVFTVYAGASNTKIAKTSFKIGEINHGKLSITADTKLLKSQWELFMNKGAIKIDLDLESFKITRDTSGLYLLTASNRSGTVRCAVILYRHGDNLNEEISVGGHCVICQCLDKAGQPIVNKENSDFSCSEGINGNECTKTEILDDSPIFH